MEPAPLREIKPVVIPAQFFVWGPLMAGFISIFPGFFTFVLSNMIGMILLDRIGSGPVVVYGVAAYALSFAVTLALLWVKFFQEPARTTYAVYADRVEYDEGLWNRRRRTVVFDQVIDVELTEGVLQQTQAAGTVTLVTQQLVSGQEGQLSNRRFSLVNVPQPREMYELMRSLALRGRGSREQASP